jgi:hypothetical protein
MTKQFNSFTSFHEWLIAVKDKAREEAIPKIAEQIYKDSRKYTYYSTITDADHIHMYDTGQLYSDFKNGYVIERKPYVKWLYYTTWIKAGDGNPKAVPQWFEATIIENRSKYEKIYADSFNKAKREV